MFEPIGSDIILLDALQPEMEAYCRKTSASETSVRSWVSTYCGNHKRLNEPKTKHSSTYIDECTTGSAHWVIGYMGAREY